MTNPTVKISEEEQYIELEGICEGGEPFRFAFDSTFLSYCRDKEELELMLSAMFDSHGNQIGFQVLDTIVGYCRTNYTLGSLVNSEWGKA